MPGYSRDLSDLVLHDPTSMPSLSPINCMIVSTGARLKSFINFDFIKEQHLARGYASAHGMISVYKQSQLTRILNFTTLILDQNKTATAKMTTLCRQLPVSESPSARPAISCTATHCPIRASHQCGVSRRTARIDFAESLFSCLLAFDFLVNCVIVLLVNLARSSTVLDPPSTRWSGYSCWTRMWWCHRLLIM
jgi:hypothetical protein